MAEAEKWWTPKAQARFEEELDRLFTTYRETVDECGVAEATAWFYRYLQTRGPETVPFLLILALERMRRNGEFIALPDDTGL